MYRNELEAARSRIAVLEDKLAENEKDSPFARELRRQRDAAQRAVEQMARHRRQWPLRLAAVLTILAVVGLATFFLTDNRVAVAPAAFAAFFVPILVAFAFLIGPGPDEKQAKEELDRLDLALAAAQSGVAQAKVERVRVSSDEAQDSADGVGLALGAAVDPSNPAMGMLLLSDDEKKSHRD